MEESLIYEKNTLEFVTIAAEYCAFIERVDEYSLSDFLNKSQKILVALYLKASLLPDIEPLEEGYNERFVTEADWMFISEKVQEKLGKFEQFIDVSASVLVAENDSENISLSEAYADLYQELMDFISLYRIGNEEIMNDALWECQQNFQHYWGIKLLAAQQAIHQILYGKDILE